MLTKVQDLKRKNYQDTLKIQESLREQVLSNASHEYLILVEHEHVYTLGKNANSSNILNKACDICLLYTSPSPRDVEESRMPSSA